LDWAGFAFVELDTMADKKPTEKSPESLARVNRQRLAAEEGARAMADVEQKSVAVRRNMERLRALRQAREEEEAKIQASAPADTKKKRKVKAKA
jgi:hypothetical protein